MNQEMQNVANAIMYSAIMHDKKQEEPENKARKYDELKEAVGKTKEDITERANSIMWQIDSFEEGFMRGLITARENLEKHTEGLL